eukprot:gene438-890_t
MVELEMLYEEKEVGPGNVGLFANCDIAEGTVIFREAPFVANAPNEAEYQRELEKNIKHCDQMLQWEFEELSDRIRIASMLNQGWYSEEERFSPAVKKDLDRHFEIGLIAKFLTLSDEKQNQWMSLHDAFQDIPTNCISLVFIFGCDSGKQLVLNGRFGESQGFDSESQSYFVKIDGQEDLVKIKRENLKTPGGVFRTNCYPTGLFEIRSRMNHSCAPNVESFQVGKSNDGEYEFRACRDIQAGEELTACYLNWSEATTEKRRAVILANSLSVLKMTKFSNILAASLMVLDRAHIVLYQYNLEKSLPLPEVLVQNILQPIQIELVTGIADTRYHHRNGKWGENKQDEFFPFPVDHNATEWNWVGEAWGSSTKTANINSRNGGLRPPPHQSPQAFDNNTRTAIKRYYVDCTGFIRNVLLRLPFAATGIDNAHDYQDTTLEKSTNPALAEVLESTAKTTARGFPFAGDFRIFLKKLAARRAISVVWSAPVFGKGVDQWLQRKARLKPGDLVAWAMPGHHTGHNLFIMPPDDDIGVTTGNEKCSDEEILVMHTIGWAKEDPAGIQIMCWRPPTDWDGNEWFVGRLNDHFSFQHV